MPTLPTMSHFFKDDRLGVRLSHEDKWLYFDTNTCEWVINQRKRHAKRTIELNRFAEDQEFQAMQVLIFHA